MQIKIDIVDPPVKTVRLSDVPVGVMFRARFHSREVGVSLLTSVRCSNGVLTLPGFALTRYTDSEINTTFLYDFQLFGRVSFNEEE